MTDFRIALDRDDFSLADHLLSSQCIAYKQESDMSYNLVIASVDGAQKRKVFGYSGGTTSCPLAWDPIGRAIYFSHNNQIHATDLRTLDTRQVTTLEENASVYWHLQCSPDGERLLFRLDRMKEHHRENSLCTIGTNGEGFRVVAKGPNIWQSAANWQRNVLVWSTTRGEIWTSDLNGKNSRCLASGFCGAHHFNLSPDGKEAVFESHDGLHILSTLDGNSDRIVSAGKCPAWSPDGKWIAFVKTDWDLWLLDVNSLRSHRILRVRGGGFSWEWKPRREWWRVRPVWSEDSRFLWFRVTKVRRMLRIEDPDLKQMPESDFLRKLPPQERKEIERNFKEYAHKKFFRRDGVADFLERKIRLFEEQWGDMAWAPREFKCDSPLAAVP